RDYTSDSADLDGFVRDNDLMLVVLAAGNDGIDDDGDGEIDPGSIISPANAKNGIAVGASESLRSGGGYANLSYGDVWPSDYPAEPIRSDLTSNDTGGMAAFSSRGYTTDGRLKPDIVAPGTNIISTRSSVGTDSLWGIYDARYLYSGGTSMATPIVSGAAAILRQYLRIQGTEPTASLMKAILIVTADDMDGQYASGGAAEPIPNIHEGWGRLNLSRALDLRSRELAYVNHGPTLRTGQYINYSIPCVGGDDLRITLTWTDEPGSPLASVALVNDLDLTVVAPDGTVYKGNIFSGGHSVTGNGNADPDWDTDGDGYDDRNNVECVYIDMPGNGTWTVQVSARDADGGQDFSLAILGRTGPDFSTANLTLDAKSVLGSPVNVTVDVRNVGFLPNLTGRLDLGPERGNLTFTPSDLVDAPNGTLALAVGPGGRIRVITFDGAWNASGAGGDLRAVAFHPDGRYALIAGDQGLFRWTPSSGVMRVADGDLRDVAFLPNGTAIAVGNGTVVTYPGARRVILDDPCDSSAGWSTGGTKDVWERGAPHASQAFPGNHSPADVWGTDLNASTPTSANMWLRRDVDLTGYENPVLTFWHYRDFEDGYDGGVIEVLGASQWKTVVPEGGYDGYVEALGGPGFHSLRGWSRESVFLDDYAGGLVSIRFRFASDGSINRAGWFIDDARIVDWNASERSVGDDLERVATNRTGALAAGVSRLVSIPSMDVLKPDGLDPAGLWWDGAWYVVDRNGSILRLDGSLTRVAGTGNVSDVERFEGGWIAAEDGVYRYNGSLHRFADVTVDIIAPDHRLEHLAVIGDRLYDLSRELASPVVELSVDGHVIGRTVSTGNVTFRWTPAIAGVVTLIATVNPPGPRRIPEADLSDNTFMLDIVVRTQKRFVLVVDDDGG
ncbi:MAG TPA: hypothetical protein EYP43_01750, partial [Thermoplasmata archaeon]|nr:hypothetical protein [Thermoplasmata archaeon]